MGRTAEESGVLEAQVKAGAGAGLESGLGFEPCRPG